MTEGPVRPATTLRMDWVLTVLSVWLIGGFYVDLWAHAHGEVDNRFFTPWHTFLYLGAATFLVILGGLAVLGGPRHVAVRDVLPAPYAMSFAGAILFGVAGVLDLAWHTVFGFEVDLEALLSPTHLLLAASGLLMLGGPLRSASARLAGVGDAARSWRLAGPFVIPLAMALAVFNAFTQYVNPVVDAWSSAYPGYTSDSFEQAMGAAGILVASALLAGAVAVARRRGSLPFGSFAVLVGAPVVLVALIHDEYRFIPAAIASGLLADVIARNWPPHQSRLGDALVSFLVPVLFFGGYFATMAVTTGIGWTIHLWLGSIVIAGIIGLLVDEVAQPAG